MGSVGCPRVALRLIVKCPPSCAGFVPSTTAGAQPETSSSSFPLLSGPKGGVAVPWIAGPVP